MVAPPTMDVEVTASHGISRQEADQARSRFESLERYSGHALTAGRLTLRHVGAPADNLHVADASVLFDGRLLAAHAAGPSAAAAADAVVERLRVQLRRTADSEVTRREERAEIGAALETLEPDPDHRPQARLKPPEERAIVTRRTYAPGPEPTLSAVADMLDLDEEFHLFVHARTGEDAVVYRRDDGRIGLIHPRGSELADEGEDDIVVPEPSRYSEPLALDTARAEMDELNHRFLYFIDAGDGRGKVLYLRHDGDYGLVEAE
jgi:ribosome-associated translation inhibitor RaiA